MAGKRLTTFIRARSPKNQKKKRYVYFQNCYRAVKNLSTPYQFWCDLYQKLNKRIPKLIQYQKKNMDLEAEKRSERIFSKNYFNDDLLKLIWLPWKIMVHCMTLILYKFWCILYKNCHTGSLDLTKNALQCLFWRKSCLKYMLFEK